VEDLLAMLNGNDASARETRAVAAAIYFVDDRMVRIAGAQEIGVQRVHSTIVDRRIRGLQRLPEHLAAEDAAMAGIAALPFEAIRIELFELQNLQYIGEQWIHKQEAVGG
jgi:hypothetical protein